MVTADKRRALRRFGRMCIVPAALFWLLVASSLLFSQTGSDFEFDGKKVTRIVFEPGDQPYPTQRLLDLLPLKAGAVFHLRDLPQSIQALFSTGRYADIGVDATSFENGVMLRFLTKRAY